MDIDYIVIKSLYADLTIDEKAVLDEWLCDEEHQRVYQRMLARSAGEKDIVEMMDSIDVESALAKVKSKSRVHIYNRKGYASIWRLGIAASVALVMGIGASLWYNEYTRVVPPDITVDIKCAMKECVESGRSMPDGALANVSQSPISREEIESYNLDKDVVEAFLAPKRKVTYQNKEFWLTLDDSTLVHLNNGTHIIYPENFGRSQRDVILDGEAYFMVSKDRSRPFIVHTHAGDIKVYGTEFNVSTQPNDGSEMEVVLVKGKVSVTPQNGKEVFIAPGQMAVLDGGISIRNVDTTLYTAWNIGRFDFKEWRLEDIMKVICRWYSVKAEFANEDAKDIRISGSLDRYDEIVSTIEALINVSDCSINCVDNKIIIK